MDKLLVTLAASLLIFVSANAQDRVISENERLSLRDQAYVFFVHSQPRYLLRDVISNASVRVMDFANSRQIQSIGVVNGFHNRYFAQHYRDGIVADPSYFWLDRVDRFMESRGGQHRLQFTNARDFVIGGGMLTHCLCEFLRDVLRSASIARSSYLRLILVTDAIYDMSVFGDRNMQAFIDLRGASELNRIIQERVVGQGGQRFCPQQNNFDFDRIFGFNYNVRVFLGDQKIGENSSVLSNAPQIDIVAIASNDLFSLFPMSTVGRPTEQRSLEPAR